MKNIKTKQAIRKEILEKRDSIPESVRKEKDALISERIIGLREFTNAKAILFYASFRSETDTKDMIDASFRMGKSVVLPKVDKKNRTLRLYEIINASELSRGYMGIPEPSVPENRLRAPESIDLIIIPGAGYDVHGNRLGYGAGYYDRLLSGIKKKIPVIAPAYEEQVVEDIPSEAHDIKVDRIVTDKKIIECGR